jgi:hypothetical protein
MSRRRSRAETTMSLRRLLPAAALALTFCAPAFAANEKGFLWLPGVQGPSSAMGHEKWFPMPASDLGLEAEPGVQCELVADVAAAHAAPALAGVLGQTLAEVKLDLTDLHGAVYYKIRMTSVRVRKVVSSTENGLHVESLTLVPASLTFEVKKRGPSGQLEPGTQETVTCGAVRS